MLLTHSKTLTPTRGTASTHAVARTARAAVSVLGRTGGAIWRYLEEVGQARAQRQLRLLTVQWAVSDPEMAKQMHQASQFDVRSGATSAASTPDQTTPRGAAGAAP